MNATLFRALGLLLGVAGLAGCDLPFFEKEPADPLMTQRAIATREAPAENIFEGELAGERMFLLLHDCEVYRVDRDERDRIRWQSVLAPEFYPLWSACQRQGMSFKNGALTVTLGRMAFGAGGCCATGGTWRSVDGRTWKKISENTVPHDPSEGK